MHIFLHIRRVTQTRTMTIRNVLPTYYIRYTCLGLGCRLKPYLVGLYILYVRNDAIFSVIKDSLRNFRHRTIKN